MAGSKKAAAATKTTVKKSAPKKAAPKKAIRKKATPDKATAQQVPAKKVPAKKAAARPATGLAAGASRAAAEPRTASPLLRATAAPTEPVAATPPRRLHVVPDRRDDWEDLEPAPADTSPTTTRPRAAALLDLLGVIAGEGERIDDAVGALVNLLRVGATAAGLDTDETEDQIARTLAYLRRRASGDYTVDEFGFDEDFTNNVWLPLLRPLYQKWFRVEVRGAENLPVSGAGLIVANHSGTVPIDGMMTQVAVHEAVQRHLRLLGADLVFELPFVGTNARRAGSTLATAADAERLLQQGELVAVYPEGFKGVGKPFAERYKLQRFGRGGFVSAALRTGVPIIPCSIVGAEEIYPLIGNISPIARLVGAPYFPVTPFFPLLGPLGLIPLPSKWIIAFGEPVDTADIGPAGADDPMLVFDLTDQVRETIQQTLYSLLMQRRSVFF